MTKIKALITTLVLAVVFIFGGGLASAHHPEISGVATCADANGGYTVNWTVAADAVRGYTWVIDNVAKADSATFTYQTTHNLSGATASLTKSATWYTGYGTNKQVKKAGPESRTGTVQKPNRCPVVTTTTTTTTAPPTTTTAPPTTTTQPPTTTTAPPTTTLPPVTTTTLPPVVTTAPPTTVPPVVTTVPPTIPPTTVVAVTDPPVPTTILTPEDRQEFLPATGAHNGRIVVLATILLVLGLLLLAIRLPRLKP
jgi:hypothetical protein